MRQTGRETPQVTLFHVGDMGACVGICAGAAPRRGSPTGVGCESWQSAMIIFSRSLASDRTRDHPAKWLSAGRALGTAETERIGNGHDGLSRLHAPECRAAPFRLHHVPQRRFLGADGRATLLYRAGIKPDSVYALPCWAVFATGPPRARGGS